MSSLQNAVATQAHGALVGRGLQLIVREVAISGDQRRFGATMQQGFGKITASQIPPGRLWFEGDITFPLEMNSPGGACCWFHGANSLLADVQRGTLIGIC